MDNTQIDLRVFIRNFVNRIPKDRDKKKPLICIEFEDPVSTSGYSSRVYIYSIESLSIIRYKYNADGSSENTQSWSVPGETYTVFNLIPPAGRNRRILPQSVKSNLGVIQVGNAQ